MRIFLWYDTCEEECTMKTNTIASVRQLLMLLSLGAAFAALTSCSTFWGFGKDVEKTGDKIQNAAAS